MQSPLYFIRHRRAIKLQGSLASTSGYNRHSFRRWVAFEERLLTGRIPTQSSNFPRKGEDQVHIKRVKLTGVSPFQQHVSQICAQNRRHQRGKMVKNMDGK